MAVTVEETGFNQVNETDRLIFSARCIGEKELCRSFFVTLQMP